LAEVAAYYFEAGFSDYPIWAEQIVSQLGDSVKPHLRKAWISIPRIAELRAKAIAVDPLTTQAERVAASVRVKDLIACWEASYRAKALSDEMQVFPHPHLCPVCRKEWTCEEFDCFLPDEYWCATHAGSKPLPQRLASETHDHYCPNCGGYWEHRYRKCLLPGVYECDEHGGISDEDFLREAALPKSLVVMRRFLARYVSVLGAILCLLLAALFSWPYAFYVLLRVGVCTISVYWAVEAFKRQQVAWTWALGANAVLFNPLLPVHMASEQWEIVDLFDAIFLASFTSISFYRDRRRDRSTLSGDSRS
jgi:hypothetical protein